ncbi:hypothetical protein BDC45DRAFT_95973 [Circinella umbellata]|nr:hypothetical protein BDC45DRAFT_95973 [Circinella umbellata]
MSTQSQPPSPLNVNLVSHFEEEKTMLPYKTAKRNISLWNLFIYLARHGTYHEKRKIGLPERFKYKESRQQLKELFSEAKNNEDTNQYLKERVEEENKRKAGPPTRPEDRRTLAKSYLDQIGILLAEMESNLGVDAALTLHSKTPDDMDNKMVHTNSGM